jgi:DNA-directed RNA polymerase subunit RPC12/RpoP
MGLFKRLSVQPVAITPNAATPTAATSNAATGAYSPPDLGAEIERQLKTARSRIFAYSEYVKQVDCSRCGATKQLPTKTAYLYCDFCGALIDYDFRVGNFGTNAALTNQVFAFLMAPVQTDLERAIVLKDRDRYRQLIRPVYQEWMRQVPMACSPRATSDEDFRKRTVDYMVECLVTREFSPQAHGVGDQLAAATRALQRIPQPNGDWLVGDGIWQVAALYKQQMEMSYQLLKDTGVLAMEPEETPMSVQLKMEYSYFCQNWLPKIPPQDTDRFLAFFGLKSEYTKANIANADTRKCGGCGDELKTVPGAQAVICESCGRKLDIAGGEVPCQRCGAPLSFPVGVGTLPCPYCHSETHRV